MRSTHFIFLVYKGNPSALLGWRLPMPAPGGMGLAPIWLLTIAYNSPKGGVFMEVGGIPTPGGGENGPNWKLILTALLVIVAILFKIKGWA